MERSFNQKSKESCALCCREVERLSSYCCFQNHHYCQSCFRNYKYALGVSEDNKPISCLICKGKLEMRKTSTRFESPQQLVRSTKHPLGTTNNHCKNYQDFQIPSTSVTNLDEDKLFETLIGMSKEKFYERQRTYKRGGNHDGDHQKEQASQNNLNSIATYSKKPYKCPHMPCGKTVTISQFINHFKSEHEDIPCYSVLRGKELLVPCNITVVQHDCHLCLGMITVYEINRINFVSTTSSESVVRTCNKFCQKVPLNTFWLMVTGSTERQDNSAFCLFWMFTNSEEHHKCTLELGSKNDSVSLSTYCAVATAFDKDFVNMKKKLQCLLVTKSSLRSLLKESALLNLRVIVH